MPHQCTNCGHVFPDGSKEMLSGCPDCGGNKFQFKQGSVDDVTDGPDDPSDSQPATDRSADRPADRPVDRPVDRPADSPDTASAAAESTGETTTDEPSTPPPDPPSSSDPQTTDSPPTTIDPGSTGTSTDSSGADAGDAELMDSTPSQDGESPAQSTARSDIVSDDELPDAAPSESQPPTTDAPRNSEIDSDTPADEAASAGLDQLRQELNDQFESIRIVSPGQYELNLMELYDRNEYIISLREDGRYVIEVPDGWGADEN